MTQPQPKIRLDFGMGPPYLSEPWFILEGEWSDLAHDAVIQRIVPEFNLHFAGRMLTETTALEAGIMATSIATTMVARGELVFINRWQLPGEMWHDPCSHEPT